MIDILFCSLSVLKQLQRAYCNIATTNQLNELNDTLNIDHNQLLMLLDQLKNLSIAKKDFVLSLDEQRSQGSRINEFNHQKEAFLQSLTQNTLKVNLDKELMPELASENSQLKLEIELLEKELEPFNFELTEANLDKKLQETQNVYTQLLQNQ